MRPLPRAEDLNIPGWEVLTVGEMDAPVDGLKAGCIILQQWTGPVAEATPERVVEPPVSVPGPSGTMGLDGPGIDVLELATEEVWSA